MKHSDYWRGRFEALNESLLRQGMDCYDDIEREYRQAMQRIEKDITVWYQRLAANNDVSFAAAKKLLSANELEEFRWSVEQYIRKGKENALNQRWIKQLENASAKVHISRLEAIKLQLQQHLELLYGNQLDGMDKAMRKLYQAGYYRAAFEVQRGIGVGFDFASIDENRLQKILAKPWAADGKTFSDRIWQSKAQLVNALHTELTQATIRGDPPEQAVRSVAKKMNASLSNAGRLVMTESAFFASASQKDCFDELGVERYEIVATLDLKTSPICREMDGKVFKQSDYKPGVTAPPLHCWCRSCTAPYFEDNPGVRAARGEDGKTHHVPADMHYEDWYKVYVEKTVKPDEWRKSREKDIMKEKAWRDVDYVPKYGGDKRAAIKSLSNKHGIVFLDSRKYPMDADLLDDCVSWLDAFSDEYKDFTQKNPCKIPVIKCQAPSKMGQSVGYYRYYPGNTRVVELALNGKFHSDTKGFQQYIDASRKIKWYPQNATLHKTFVHEFGHHISNSMKNITGRKTWEKEFIDQCINEFNQKAGKTLKGYWEIGEYVSNYAASSVTELFAEAFAEYFGGENPRMFAEIFGKKLEEILRTVK